MKPITLIPKARFASCICLLLMILVLPKFMTGVTILILKLSILYYLMVMFLALHPMKFIFLNSSDLLEHLAMLQTSRNKLLTEKCLKKGYWYHKLCKTLFF